jgi:undecaprenyl-diphosphatase
MNVDQVSNRTPVPMRTRPRQQLVKLEHDIVAAELPAQQEIQRGRRFVHLYVAALIVAAVAFGMLSVAAHQSRSLLSFDVWITKSIQGVNLPGYGWVLTHVSDLGHFPFNAIAYVAVFAGLFVLRLRLEAVLAVLSSILVQVAGAVTREMVGRPRPTPNLVRVDHPISGYGFPSGHVLMYATLFGFAAYVILVSWRSALLRTLVVALLGLLVLLVGPSRVYLGAHWMTDTIGAYLLAGLWIAGTIELHLYLKRRDEPSPDLIEPVPSIPPITRMNGDM